MNQENQRTKTKGRVMAIDYGSVRVGVAISDPSGLIARGIETIQRQGSDKPVIARLLELIETHEVTQLVLGMPLRTDGKESAKGKEVKQFSKALQAASGLRPIYRDERYTSVIAAQIMLDSGVKSKKKRDIVDQVAAEVILQDYLNESR